MSGVRVKLDTLYFCTVLRRAQGESVRFGGFFSWRAQPMPAGLHTVIELLTFLRL
jgi:hypothetical protein